MTTDAPASIRRHGPYLLRPATAADVPTILTLIQELAEFERLRHEVIATEEMLREHLFGPRPTAEVLLVETEAKGDDHTAGVAGFALFFQNFSTFLGRPGLYLEDLYVRPAHRRHGLGRVLLQTLAGIAVARGCGRFEWAVLDWNADAITFYESLGAKRLDDWTVCRVTGPALAALAAPRSTASP